MVQQYILDNTQPQRTWGDTKQLPSMVLAAAAAVLSGLLIVGLFTRLMNFELRKDEQLYVTPTRLLENQSLYVDFFYNHTPGSAWWFHAIRQLSGSDYLLFDARIGMLIAWLVFAAAIAGFAFTLTRSGWIAWSICLLSLVNELFLTQVGMSASNNFVLLPLAFIGLALFVTAISSNKPRPIAAALSGVFLSLAVLVKISAAAFIVPVVVAALLLPGNSSLGERLRSVMLPLAAGGIVGGLPILFYLFTDGERFLAHVLGYHLGPHVEYFRGDASVDDGAPLTLPAKLVLAHDLWFGTAMAAGLVSLAVILFLRITESVDRPRRVRSWDGAAIVLVAGVFCVGAIFSLIPTPSFPQYFSPPLIALPLALAILVSGLSPAGRARAKIVLVAATLVAVVSQAPRLLQHVRSMAHPGGWTVSRVHASGIEIAERLASAGLTGKVATLAPIYPLEGGVPVYAEFATGPFAFRTADLTQPDLAKWYRMVSPSGLAELFAADPPAALLIGFDPKLEKPLLDFATGQGYEPLPDFRIRDRLGTGLLYMRPEAADQGANGG